MELEDRHTMAEHGDLEDQGGSKDLGGHTEGGAEGQKRASGGGAEELDGFGRG